MTDHSHRNGKLVCWISIWSKLEKKHIGLRVTIVILILTMYCTFCKSAAEKHCILNFYSTHVALSKSSRKWSIRTHQSVITDNDDLFCTRVLSINSFLKQGTVPSLYCNCCTQHLWWILSLYTQKTRFCLNQGVSRLKNCDKYFRRQNSYKQYINTQ